MCSTNQKAISKPYPLAKVLEVKDVLSVKGKVLFSCKGTLKVGYVFEDGSIHPACSKVSDTYRVCRDYLIYSWDQNKIVIKSNLN